MLGQVSERQNKILESCHLGGHFFHRSFGWINLAFSDSRECGVVLKKRHGLVGGVDWDQIVEIFQNKFSGCGQ